MTVYVNERCHKCRTSLTGWIPNYYAIDVPYIICPSCKTFNDRSAKANEWALSDSARKAFHYLLSLYWGLAYGVGFAVAIGFIEMNYSPELAHKSVGSIEVVFSLLVGLVLGVATSFVGLYRRVHKSNRRLENNVYRQILIKHGYMSDKPN